MNVMALIPARGGSKGIKRKNLVELAGKSLLAWSVEHAICSSCINRVVVSTEDNEIARIAKDCGAEVPFIRPAHLAEDHVLDLPVFQHALNYLQQEDGYSPDYVVHLRPTAPYRKAEWIDEAVDKLMNNPDADSVRSVSEPAQHPYRVFEVDQSGMLQPVMQHRHVEPYLLRRQDLPEMYYYNCVIDVTKPQTILNKNSMTGDNMLPYIMNADEVIDIDSERDLEIARCLFEDKL